MSFKLWTYNFKLSHNEVNIISTESCFSKQLIAKKHNKHNIYAYYISNVTMM